MDKQGSMNTSVASVLMTARIEDGHGVGIMKF